MNRAYGAPGKGNMPFDLAHKRFPITYKLSADATSGDRNEEIAKLAKTLERVLRAVLDHHLSTVPEVTPAAFPAKAPRMGKARYRLPISDTDNITSDRLDRSIHLFRLSAANSGGWPHNVSEGVPHSTTEQGVDAC